MYGIRESRTLHHPAASPKKTYSKIIIKNLHELTCTQQVIGRCSTRSLQDSLQNVGSCCWKTVQGWPARHSNTLQHTFGNCWEPESTWWDCIATWTTRVRRQPCTQDIDTRHGLHEAHCPKCPGQTSRLHAGGKSTRTYTWQVHTPQERNMLFKHEFFTVTEHRAWTSSVIAATVSCWWFYIPGTCTKQ